MEIEKILKEHTETSKTNVSGHQRRVAAYCRVSTSKDAQAGSFELQKNVYLQKITAHPDWVFAGIYADEGVTGTNTKYRTGFQQMLADCEAGKIDYIITKSISRFARNTLECLSYIRKLQSMGVQLIFEKENIDTGEPFSEMLLTVLAAFAQEESRSLSENLKWGIRKRYQKGIDRWTRIYGYTQTEEGSYRVVPEEADTVRQIFLLYEQGQSMSEIVAFLHQHQIPSPAGKKDWSASSVLHILRNEKYTGDILLQKTYTADHISHRTVKNNCTLVPAYYLTDHHTPLISHEQFAMVEKIRKLRCPGGSDGNSTGHPVQYPFDTLLHCPFCGAVLRQRHIPVQQPGRGWLCEGSPKSCGGFLIRSHFVEQAVLTAYHTFPKEQLALADSGHAAEAKHMRAFLSAHPRLPRVDYYWLARLVDSITFGRHIAQPQNGMVDDRTLYVHWKCGVTSCVPTGIEKQKDLPSYVLKRYRDWQVRNRRKNENHTDCPNP